MKISGRVSRFKQCLLGVAVAIPAVMLLMPSVASANGRFDHQRVVVGVGDSFTSGEGAPPFVAGTDTPTDQCHRSEVAYPLVAAFFIGATGENVACSGAETKDLFTTFRSEPAQASRLGNATDIVTTIGGNDINALESIANPPTPEQLSAELRALDPVLVKTYQGLHAADPSARVYAVGYPSIFGTAAAPSCPLSQQQRVGIVAATQALDNTIQLAASQAQIRFVDTFNVFAGHELCTAAPWVNNVDTVHPSFSLHPNFIGQIVMGERVAVALAPHLKN